MSDDYTVLYPEHTALVSCGRCRAVLRATDRAEHQRWHVDLDRKQHNHHEPVEPHWLRPGADTSGGPIRA